MCIIEEDIPKGDTPEEIETRNDSNCTAKIGKITPYLIKSAKIHMSTTGN